jgi:hypothetical protein
MRECGLPKEGLWSLKIWHSLSSKMNDLLVTKYFKTNCSIVFFIKKS